MIIWLHGLEGHPNGAKAQALRGAFGDELVAPDMRNRVPAGRLEVIEAALAKAGDGPHLVAGSSLGGWLAAIVAEKQPERVGRLVLFVPAFHPTDADRPIPDHIPDPDTFMAQMDDLPGLPTVTCPADVVIADDVVPHEHIQAWLELHPGVRVQLWDDGHRLDQSIPRVVELVQQAHDEMARDSAR